MYKRSNPFINLKGLLIRIRKEYRNNGINYVLKAVTAVMLNRIIFSFYIKLFKIKRKFQFQDETYFYFYHWHNTSWRNERAVEVPIIKRLIDKYKGKSILEVGNVLSYYFPVKHDILDKYDLSENIIKQDVVDFSPAKKYDLIVSISTLEHVGWDETPKDPKKTIKAVEKLKKCLAINGKMVVTFPLCHNEALDISIKKGKLKFDKLFFLQRKLPDVNVWVESTKQIKSNKKSKLLIPQNGLAIGVIENGQYENN